LYHLAVVIDDADEGVTHIIRGEDHISNTPRHILIQRALGFSTPAYAHIPLLLMPDRSKMSKRKHQSSVKFYREQGIVPEALINYLALLGWNPGDGREYLSLSDLIASFDLTRVQKGGAVFDETKLLSVNHHWMRELSDADYISQLPTYAPTAAMIDTSVLGKLIPLLKERARTFREAEDLLQGELVSLYQNPTLIQKDILLAKEPGRPVAKQALERLAEKLAELPEGAAVEEIKAVLMPLAEEEERRGKGGRGGVLWPLRYALSGAERSPDPFTIISLIGRHEALDRVQAAIAIL
jgi:glutamyl/glutaminyl-tRNA synthetase